MFFTVLIGLCQYTRNRPFNRVVTFKVASDDYDFNSTVLRARFDGTSREEETGILQDYSYSTKYMPCTNGSDQTCKAAEVIIFWAEKTPFKMLSFCLYQFDGANISPPILLSNLTLSLGKSTTAI